MCLTWEWGMHSLYYCHWTHSTVNPLQSAWKWKKLEMKSGWLLKFGPKSWKWPSMPRSSQFLLVLQFAAIAMYIEFGSWWFAIQRPPCMPSSYSTHNPCPAANPVLALKMLVTWWAITDSTQSASIQPTDTNLAIPRGWDWLSACLFQNILWRHGPGQRRGKLSWVLSIPSSPKICYRKTTWQDMPSLEIQSCNCKGTHLLRDSTSQILHHICWQCWKQIEFCYCLKKSQWNIQKAFEYLQWGATVSLPLNVSSGNLSPATSLSLPYHSVHKCQGLPPDILLLCSMECWQSQPWDC